MPNRNPNAAGVCGLYCGACVYWGKWHDQDDRFMSPEEQSADKTVCNGCRSSRVSSGCANCGIRECAQARGVATCADCADGPCEKVQGLIDLPRPHLKGIAEELERIGEIGEGAWADIQRDKWTCGKCGTHTTWYQQTCPACGVSLPGFDIGQWRG